MTELRSVNPRDLKANPDNPRKFGVFPHEDQQLVASIRAIGIVQPPLVREADGALLIVAGHRRVAAAIEADLPMINVIVTDSTDTSTAMEALSENMVRAPMNRVDVWRAVQKLETLGWQEQAIADALAFSVRGLRGIKLLAHIHPPMLDALAVSIAKDELLRVIGCATLEEQAQVWKKHKPKKGEAANWFAIANALSKRRIPFSAAKFDDALAAKYGVVWEEDLFMPAGDENRYTTNVDGFFGAQQEWLEGHLPKNGVLLPQDDHGHPTLPKKAQRVWGKPAKGDMTGHYLDPRTAEVETIVYRMPAEPKASKAKGGTAEAPEIPVKAPRPDVTQKGQGIIGDLRTDALHESLLQDPASDITLIGLLVLTLGGRNVSIQSPLSFGRFDREATWGRIAAGGVLTQDHDAIRQAAREILAQTLSCREGMSNSGVGALIAAAAIGADLRLPSMATEDFLSCLSRQALEREAAANGLRVEARVKDTRANMVSHFADATWVYPGATFALTQDQIDAIETGDKTSGPEDDLDGEDEASSEEGDDGYAEFADAAD
ncbi:ParB/RepB/Spo0J family partition protein [Acidisoma sp. 7E03]